MRNRRGRERELEEQGENRRGGGKGRRLSERRIGELKISRKGQRRAFAIRAFDRLIQFSIQFSFIYCNNVKL